MHTYPAALVHFLAVLSLVPALTSLPNAAMAASHLNDGSATFRPVAPAERLGPVWPIQEPDMRRLIEARLRERLPALRSQLADRLAAYRVPAMSMPTRPAPKQIEIDPSITLAADLTDHTGAVLAKSGARLNPLSVMPLRRTYLVINGADPRQLLWAKDQIADAPATVLLTDGSLQAVRAAFSSRVSVYPAPAALFARFPIDSVPARLARVGEKISLDLVAEQSLAVYTDPADNALSHKRVLDSTFTD